MRRLTQVALVAATAVTAVLTAAHADTFTWDPTAIGLAGPSFSADAFTLGDYALIQFSPNATFLDVGIMPILGFTHSGQSYMPTGYGSAWGAYLSYQAHGQQFFDERGVPSTATFDSLSLTVYGYNGTATFSTDANGIPDVTSQPAQAIFSGKLTTGGLRFGFDPAHPTGLTIEGTVETSAELIQPSFSSAPLSALDVNFIHSPEEYIQRWDVGQIRIPGGGTSSTSVLTLAAGTGSSPAFINTGAPVDSGAPADSGAPTGVPEPPAALLLPAFLLAGLVGARAKR